MKITTGAPKIDVTVLMLSSIGAKMLRAIRSHTRQNTAPARKEEGMTISGFEVWRRLFVRKGTAIPTKETGPAKAVTVAERMLERRISTGRKSFVFTPIVRA